jgi:hypothetical protein
MLTYPKGVTSSVVTPQHFGALGDNSVDDTIAMLAFYNHCIDNLVDGYIPSGVYKLTTGVLHFNNLNTDKAWPNIYTAGHDAVEFRINPATETNAPLLRWSNGTAASTVGRYWRGGCHGGVTVYGSGTGTPYAAQHHFSFTGMWHVNLGWMASNNCKGSSFHIPQNLYSGNNPDPYACSFMAIEGLESNYAAGWAVLNENGLGMDGWVVEHVRIIEPSSGGWFGIGSGCTINNISCANTRTGYAFDDGTFVTNIAGSPQRNMIRVAEFDNCQLGVRLNVCTRTRIEAVRFVHRYQTTPNAAAVYWPTTAMSIGAGTSPSIADVYIDVSDRYESGGVIGVIGTWADFGNVAHGGIIVDVDYQDNGSLGLTDANFTGSNVNGSASISIRKRFVSLREQLVRRAILVRASTASTIPFHVTPILASTNVLTFATELSDRSNMYDNSTYKATVPYTGLYHLFGRICFPSAVGTKVILGFFADTTAALTRTDYSRNVGDQTYEISGVVLLTAGQLVSFNGVQNTAGAINLTTPVSASSDLIWSMVQIA